ncbi:RAM signaling pathway domain containing protein [Naviculisporaceae sp. PSN 640]
MSSRRVPPTLQGQQQQRQKPSLPLPLPQSQQQVPRNDTPGASDALLPISPGQVLALVRDVWKKAAGGDEARPAERDGVISGLTLDLTEKNIAALPDEVVDILRNGVERLAINHNALCSVPLRFSQCTSLRYLAARNNAFEEFPLPLCELTSLEFLDLSRNRLKEIPREIAKLASLKALALQYNRIETVPLDVAGMTTLQRLKLTGNPIQFPPREVLQPPTGSLVLAEGLSKEAIERAVTSQIKNFLSQRLIAIKSGSEVDGDAELSESPDTPKVSTRRATGRFPIRIRGADGSPSQAKAQPPPIPGRSHFRAMSHVSSTSSKGGSGMIPLTMGRSREGGPRSTSVPPKPLRDGLRSESRSYSRREASVPPESEHLPEEETTPVDKPTLNRLSNHFRGISYSGGVTLTNPFSPEDHSSQRPFFVRELSAVPVRRYKSQVPDPVLEVAKGLFYSIHQIHIGVQTLMSLTNDGNAKRSSLEMVFYNTNMHFVELDQAIQDFDLSAGTRGARRDHGAMQSAYTTLINAYVHICAKLVASVDVLVDNGDPRYMRTFLMHVYHSIMELRVSLSGWLTAMAVRPRTSPSPEPLTAIETRPPSRAAVAAAKANNSPGIPNTARLGLSARRAAKLGRDMQVMTNIPYAERTRRVATLVVTGGSSAGISEPTTPSSDDSFTSAVSSPEVERNPGAQTAMLNSDGDRQFERFFIALKQTTALTLRVLTQFTSLIMSHLQRAKSKDIAEKWQTLVTKTAAVIQQIEVVQDKLSNLQLRDPSLYLQGHTRSNSGASSPFWASCNALFSAWAELGDHIKLAVVGKLIVEFPPEVIDGLRQISRSMKGSIDLMVVVRKQTAAISKSCSLLGHPGVATSPPLSHRRPGSAGTPEGKMKRIPPLPMTPQSAALGPAFRATKPLFGSSP